MNVVLHRALTTAESEFEDKVNGWTHVWTIQISEFPSQRDKFWRRYPTGAAATAALASLAKEADNRFEIDRNDDALHFQDFGWKIIKLR